jgi:uncharacterized protein YxeA
MIFLKKIVSLLICVFIITCSGCSWSKKSYVSFNDEIKTINKSRSETKPLPDIQKYLYKYNEKDEGFTDAEVDKLTNFDVNEAYKKYNYEKVLTRDMALSDVNYLFRLLKYTYGGYEYFGGDKAFNAAKDNIINKIKCSNSIKVKEFHDLICQSLAFIKDGHFSIYNNSLIDKYRNIYYYSKDYEFYKDEKGYYTLINDKKCYLESVQKSNKLQQYMKLTINSEGHLVYNIGLLQNKLTPIFKLNIELLNGKKKLDKEISLTESTPVDRIHQAGFSKQITNGIPVVTCSTMMDTYREADACKLFGESGKELKNYPVSIVDIRGNQGGFETAGDEWFEGYTGMAADINRAEATLYSKPFCTEIVKLSEQQKKNEKNMSGNAYILAVTEHDNIYNMIKNKRLNIWGVSSTQPDTLVDNKNIIYVLIDNNVASASELYIGKLRTLKNVIFVGTNTMGCDLVGGVFPYKLPNSGEVLSFGSSLYFMPNFEEGTGFMPDIWVDSPDALTRVEKLIENNKTEK